MAGLRLSKGIVSFDIGLRLVDERQGLRRIGGRNRRGLLSTLSKPPRLGKLPSNLALVCLPTETLATSNGYLDY